jgi:transposase
LNFSPLSHRFVASRRFAKISRNPRRGGPAAKLLAAQSRIPVLSAGLSENPIQMLRSGCAWLQPVFLAHFLSTYKIKKAPAERIFLSLKSLKIKVRKNYLDSRKYISLVCSTFKRFYLIRKNTRAPA